MNVLFVCTGNTCRSPMAEALLRENMANVHVKSAGIYAHSGSEANPHARSVLEDLNIDLEHAATTVTSDLLAWADVVLTMTTDHKMLLAVHFPDHEHKVFTLIEYASQDEDSSNEVSLDIDDPFGQSISVYRKTLEQMQSYLPAIIKRLG